MAAYILFAFLSNLTRELIKDIEDIEGDRSVGLRDITHCGRYKAEQDDCTCLFRLYLAVFVVFQWFIYSF
jgi:4-hydroxybenzoate polyprenyltransferase